MGSREEHKARMKFILTIVLTSLGVYLGFRFILPLILPFLIAYFLAWLIRPTTEFMFRRLKIPRIMGGTFSLLVLIAVLGTGLYYLLNTLMKQTIAFIRNLPIYLEIIAGKLDDICKSSDGLFGLADGSMRAFVDDNLLQMMNHVKTKVIPGITQKTISITIAIIGTIGIILIVLVSTILIAKDLPGFHKKYESRDFYKDVHKVTDKLADAGIAYLRSQLIIMVIVAGVCFLGLTLIKNDYALLIGICIAIMDALPILGSGIILIPWSIIMLVNGDIYIAAILMTIFLICQIFREVLEPKLIGNRIGIKPLFTLVAMYIGLKLFSIAGFVLGPIGLIIIITIVKVVMEKGNESDRRNVSFESD